MEVLDETVGQLNREGVVVLQERMQQIGFIPRAALIDPRFRIFERMKNVVEVDDHPRNQPWKNVEEDIVHIAAGLRDVRRIDEENIVRLQSCKDVEVDVLQIGGNDGDARRV